MKLTRVVFEYRDEAPEKAQLPLEEALARVEKLGRWSRIELKKLGFTTTHVRGYQLTGLGQALLDALRARPRARGKQ